MFDWLTVKRPRHHKEQRNTMYRRELEERAALLLRLGYSRKHAQSRLRANVAWDFDLHDKPRHATEVDQIVEAVYRRGGIASGPPSV